MIKIILLTFLFIELLHAGAGLLPSHYRIDQALTSKITRENQEIDVKIYLSDDDFQSALVLLESKGAILKEEIKKDTKEGSEGLPGLKDFKTSFEQQGFGDLKNATGYQRYSGRMEDGSFVVVASHYFDSEEKKWIKKTNVTLIHPSPPPAQSAPAGKKPSPLKK